MCDARHFKYSCVVTAPVPATASTRQCFNAIRSMTADNNNVINILHCLHANANSLAVVLIVINVRVTRVNNVFIRTETDGVMVAISSPSYAVRGADIVSLPAVANRDNAVTILIINVLMRNGDQMARSPSPIDVMNANRRNGNIFCR